MVRRGGVALSLGEADAPVGGADAPAGEASPTDQTAGAAPDAVEPGTGTGETIKTYVVQPGDTLSRIARDVYGNAGPPPGSASIRRNWDVIGDDPGAFGWSTLEIPQ